MRPATAAFALQDVLRHGRYACYSESDESQWIRISPETTPAPGAILLCGLRRRCLSKVAPGEVVFDENSEHAEMQPSLTGHHDLLDYLGEDLFRYQQYHKHAEQT